LYGVPQADPGGGLADSKFHFSFANLQAYRSSSAAEIARLSAKFPAAGIGRPPAKYSPLIRQKLREKSAMQTRLIVLRPNASGLSWPIRNKRGD
ncbi:MAG: hypothetical protein AAF736_11130, partial [Pseudomonadota bacterium]